MTKFFSLLFLSLLIFSVRAQTSDYITSGRPGMSIGSEVVGTHVFQIQSGVEHDGGDSQSWVTDQTLRFGLDEKFEINSDFTYRIDKGGHSGFDNLEFGARVKLIRDAKGWIPSLALQSRLRLKGVGKFKRKSVRPVTILTSIHDLKSWGALNLNITQSYNGSGGKPIYGYVVNWSHGLGEGWTYFIEEYANHDQQWNHAWDTGFAVLPTKDIQLDFSVGHDLESTYSSNFISMGISWRHLPI